MLELFYLNQDFHTCVRLLAAEIQHRKGTVQTREIATRAGRIAEQARSAGAQRWQAVKLEDDFKAAVRARLNELAGMPSGHHGQVISFASGGAV
ncbi:hypothetical protein [Agrobacterium sp. Azo12]|uniref:hypothetical protein n=1 Tax=Agrobacterium sp. Azo12 TaxID=3031129 RepID=UPI0023D82B4E|nr:hypothetical protein [Agrobacterium sp. Azo12]MDO5896541.1 hypothetical protein [Agrobacterium sp. Azo12]